MRGIIVGVFATTIGVVFALILTPLVMDQIEAIIGHSHINEFTGMEAVSNIVPLLFLVFAVIIGPLLGYSAYKKGS